MTALSAGPDAREQWREAGHLLVSGLARLLFGAGWLVAKGLRCVATLFAALLFAAGWFGSAVALPALRWCARAVSLGWQEGRKPIRRHESAD